MILLKLWLFCLIFSVQLFLTHQETASGKTNENAAKEPTKLLTEKIYSKLFQLRRKESKELLNIIMNESFYERKHKLIEVAYDKLLKILQETKSILETSKYDPMVDKFPSKDARLVDAITVTLENTCLFGEIILHVPDISYRVLETRQNIQTGKGLPHWKDLINWCIKYSRYFNERIIDLKSQELLWLLEQEINPERRSADFVNPYRDDAGEEAKHFHQKKPTAKKLKKGPQLSARNEL